jgi:hypothetical protein
MLWGRISPQAAGVVVEGDASALTEALATALVP